MRAFRLVPLAALLLAAPACAPIVETRGNLPNPDQLALVKPGDVNRDDVRAMLGTPSATATFDDETWYYISSRSETKAFLAPKVTERTVIAVSFDVQGMVKDVRTLGLEDGKNVQLVERETPTAGKELTLIQQLVGNVGKFGKNNQGYQTSTGPFGK